ncbi:MAG: DUF1553 domain-containing protein [Gemmataceae bacterium]
MGPLLTLAACLAMPAGDLAAAIDAHVGRKLADARVPPAPPASDAEFARRAYLDLTGRVPDILSARDFLDDPAKDKRAALVRALLADRRHAVHAANVWRSWLLPDASDQALGPLAPGFEAWLREQFRDNAPYDRIVRRLLTSDGGGGMPYGTSVQAFYLAQQNRPENVASVASRLFLGVKLECAQCHNHPFAKWTKKQFWETAAFFATDGDQTRGRSFTLGTGRIKMPGSDKPITARLLDGREPKLNADSRVALVDWMTARDNPFFARAAVNRVWEQLMGHGLVEPLDEESADNPASHPELLDLLAAQFAASGYDLKYLTEAIARSGAYGRTSRQTHAGQADARLFARARTRGLTPEQLYDSLALATGAGDVDPVGPPGVASYPPAVARAEFLRRFPNQDKRSEQQTSILQALYLMNGAVVTDAVSLERNENLRIIAQATSVRTSRRVEQLFLIALSRKPTAAESARLVRYVDGGGPSRDPARALCDVFWALLNGSEFCSNH